MFKIVLLFACIVACSAHAVLPLVHTQVVAPVVAAPYVHGGHGLLGYGGHGLAGYGGHGYYGHGYGHHILKRSPHFAPVGHLGVDHLGVGHLGGHGHVAPVAAIAPVAVSHQSRLDVHHSPAVVAASVIPVVKPVVAPVVAAAPLAYGIGHYGAENYGAGHYGAGHYGAGHYGTGHYGADHYGAGHYGAGLYGLGHSGAGHYGIGHGAGHLGHY